MQQVYGRNGIVPQYLIKGNHKAIIPEEFFQNVQKEKAKRSNISCCVDAVKRKYNAKYALSNVSMAFLFIFCL